MLRKLNFFLKKLNQINFYQIVLKRVKLKKKYALISKSKSYKTLHIVNNTDHARLRYIFIL